MTSNQDKLTDGLDSSLPSSVGYNDGTDWWSGLWIQALLGLLVVVLSIALGVLAVVGIQGKRLVLDESTRLIEQMGDNAVSGLLIRMQEIAALTKTEAAIAERLPLNTETFKSTLPGIIDFTGDTTVAGGGVWPEPFRFDPKVERRSFFWGRDQTNTLRYYDDYNLPGPGYHRQEWYVPARYMHPGKCYWSQSYMDPYSYQPMVTCTVATKNTTGFSGVVTIDLRLEGLYAFADEWRRKTGGYVFIVDRNNRFISFPELTWVKDIGAGSNGKRTENFILAKELAAREPFFIPMAQAMEALDQKTIATARDNMGERFYQVASSIVRESDGIDSTQAQLITAVLADPLRKAYSVEGSALYSIVDIPNDPLIGEHATGYLFHVPGTYWKLGVVKSLAEATAVADALSRSLIVYLLAIILVIITLAYSIFNRYLIVPLTNAASAMRRVSELVKRRRYLELPKYCIQTTSRNEIGQLGNAINTLIDRVVENEGALAKVNVTLERQVEARTTELSQALQQLKFSQSHLVQSEKMAMLGQMVAGLAHEINTPLGYIKNNILTTRDVLDQFDELLTVGQSLEQLLKDNDATPDQIQVTVANIAAISQSLSEQDISNIACQLTDDALFGVAQIADLVLNLRNFSRLDETSVKAVNIHSCIESSLKIGHSQLKNVVDVHKNYGELPIIECSPARINQVILNILTNAAHAVGIDGMITITTTADDNYVHIAIEDNGKGIAKDHLDNIFEPFFTTKGAGEGTGLGLAICKQIIDQHQGYIRVESDVGVGTKFTIILPIRRDYNSTAVNQE